jgi:hypothetical protein
MGLMKKLEPLLKVIAVGITALISITSALLSLPALRDLFAREISWLHDHLSPEQATTLGGVLLGLGLCLLLLEIRQRGLKPRKSLAAVGVLWILCSFGLIFLSPIHLKQGEEIGIAPAKPLPAKAKDNGEIQPPSNHKDRADQGKERSSSESAFAAEDGSSSPASTSSTTPASPSSAKGACTCPTPSSANNPPPSTPSPSNPQREEGAINFAEIKREEAGQEATEEAQEEAEETQEEAEETREEAELGF